MSGLVVRVKISRVTVSRGHRPNSRLQEENVARLVGATSSGGFSSFSLFPVSDEMLFDQRHYTAIR